MTDEAAPYEHLAELAEREFALVSAFELERLGELVALAQQRTTLVATLPARPPVAARPALARASALQQRTSAALATLCAELGRVLGDVDRGRRAARGYRGAVPATPLVDHAG